MPGQGGKPPPSWDERYGAGGYYYGTEPNDFLKAQAPRLRPGGRVLCLAEGEGRNAVFLAQAGHRVVAVDQSQVGLAKAERLAVERGTTLECVVADLAHFAIEPGAWDAVVAIWCHLPRPLRARVHAAAVRGLREGGLFLLEAYVPAQLRFGTGGPSSADLLPTLEQLRSELAGLELLHAVELEREVREGRGHHGHSAVVQVLGRKAAAAPGP